MRKHNPMAQWKPGFRDGGAAGFLDASMLIVDDQAANVQLLKYMLCEAGYRRMTSAG